MLADGRRRHGAERECRSLLGSARRRRQLSASSRRSSSGCTRSARSMAGRCCARRTNHQDPAILARLHPERARGDQRLVRLRHCAACAALPRAVSNLKKMCAIVWCYTGPLEKADELFAPIRLYNAPAIDFAGPIPWPMLQSLFDALYPAGLQWYWKADFFNELMTTRSTCMRSTARNCPPCSRPCISTRSTAPRTVRHERHRVQLPRRQFRGGDCWGRSRPSNNERMIQWAKDYWMALHPYSAGGAYLNMVMDEGAEQVRAARP